MKNFIATAQTIATPRRLAASLMAATSIAMGGEQSPTAPATTASTDQNATVFYSPAEFAALRANLTEIAGAPVAFVTKPEYLYVDPSRKKELLLNALSHAGNQDEQKFNPAHIKYLDEIARNFKFEGNFSALLVATKRPDFVAPRHTYKFPKKNVCLIFSTTAAQEINPQNIAFHQYGKSFESPSAHLAKHWHTAVLMHEAGHCKVYTDNMHTFIPALAGASQASPDKRPAAITLINEVVADSVAFDKAPSIKDHWITIRALTTFMDEEHATSFIIENIQNGAPLLTGQEVLNARKALLDYMANTVKQPAEYAKTETELDYITKNYVLLKHGLETNSLSAEKIGDNGLAQKLARHFVHHFETAYPKRAQDSFSAFMDAYQKAIRGAAATRPDETQSPRTVPAAQP